MPPRLCTAWLGLAWRLAVLAPAAAGAQGNPYRTLDAWLQGPPGRALGSVSGVAIEGGGAVWVA
jgi:hypothetical protein